MLSKLYESTTVELGYMCPRGILWFTNSDTHQVAQIQKETSTRMDIPFLIRAFTSYCHNRSDQYFSLSFFMTQTCVMTLNQGQNSKATNHTHPKSVLGL